ncbi:RCC1 repeat-containing protein [Neolecta irregularis DAH-3]|uniref:RCC1 repeat-containing protein n=1 Tax=Neolecta irregularis (strain DAH-3) TaxID=1198029 RepID=A0A1U7LGG1_NEOID|nr:RCC1 repeat-containing protein [Neolecta irregularis DAH-3]|eukprot:OLL21737.1 RCC1 repeat-containing protein [Neolecta irregularis DAH-3]
MTCSELQIHALGSNSSFQLSTGDSLDSSKPRLVKFTCPLPSSRPKSISSGGNHTLLLLQDGSCFATGENSQGQCGIPRSRPVLPSFENTGGQKWEIIAAGWSFSIFINVNSHVFSCGKGNRGELGLGKHINSTDLVQIQYFPPIGSRIVDVQIGVYHVVCILDNGQVWGWGDARKGQLGPIDSPTKTLFTPIKLPGLSQKAVTAACGREFTIIGFEDQSIQVLGGTKWGVRYIPPDFGHRPWKCIAASWGTAHILFSDGKVYSWGRNDRSQHIHLSADISLQNISAGSEHVVALDTKGNVYASGWNEHGNCGQQDLNDVCELLPIDFPLKVDYIAAGCGTTFLVQCPI